MARRSRVTSAAPPSPPVPEVRESHVDAKKAARLRPVMARLAAEGRGTARALVAEAASPDSEIHDCFEWDNDAAADKWRLWQARNYWGSIRIEVQTNSGIVKAPGYIPIVVNNEQSYRPIQEVVGRSDWRDQMMDVATRELESWQARYDALAAVASMRPVFDAIKVATTARKERAA